MERELTCVITRLNNSWGTGYSLHIRPFEDMSYYGYTKREAIARYRRHCGLQRKHITFVELKGA